MCGIAGVWALSGGAAGARDLPALAHAMGESLARRGPDGDGLWRDGEAGLALAHRRLAIIDLDDRAAQPMVGADGAAVLTYNGEIYNFRALRDELGGQGHVFTTQSDTEVLLKALMSWGVEATLPRLVGMFAFAYWDGRDRRLWLARDRLGIKPLYRGVLGGRLVFASELRAFRALDGGRPPIDRDAVGAFLRHGYIPAPWTIFEGLSKVRPGTAECFSAGHSEPRIHTFWDLRDIAQAPRDLDDAAALDEGGRLLKTAVTDRLVSDRPLGTFLSGGIDSSLVAAVMADGAGAPVRTFCIGFDDTAFDESAHAEAVATNLGTDHSTLRVTGADALQLVPKLAGYYDEPFADSSQIPTLLLSRLTREHVTVALSGDGGDEVFAGYERHRLVPGLWRRLAPWPRSLRAALGRALAAPSPGTWETLAQCLPQSHRPRMLGDKLTKLGAQMGADSGLGLYRGLTTLWPEPDALLTEGREHRGALWDDSLGEGLGLLDRMRLYDLATYLPDDILTKVDRASMAFGLEARVPLLDHRLVGFSFRLREDQLVRRGETKWLARRLLARYLPPALFDRPKAGFAVPLAAWLRGPLRDWAESLLAPDVLARSGLLRPEPIVAAWTAHQTGRANHQHRIWCVLMLQAWLQEP
ncbi:MAG: asparagine synthase (glutamine-hydrolyzing) [Rhodospirillales bacterium]